MKVPIELKIAKGQRVLRGNGVGIWPCQDNAKELAWHRCRMPEYSPCRMLSMHADAGVCAVLPKRDPE